jgi:hypothetical protein
MRPLLGSAAWLRQGLLDLLRTWRNMVQKHAGTTELEAALCTQRG